MDIDVDDSGKGIKRSHEEMSADEPTPGTSSASADSGEKKTDTKVMKTESEDKSPSKDSGSRSGSPEKQSKKRSSPSPKKASPVKKQSSELREEMDSKAKKQDEERMKMQVLVSNFTEDQLNRYEMFRRACFPKASVKRLMQSIAGSNIAQNVVIAMAGMTKVFVGEVVEIALDVKERWGDEGPIQPKHLREAVRRLKTQDAIPNSKYQGRVLPDT